MARKRASMREGPLAELFRATEAAQRGESPDKPVEEPPPSEEKLFGETAKVLDGTGTVRFPFVLSAAIPPGTIELPVTVRFPTMSRIALTESGAGAAPSCENTPLGRSAPRKRSMSGAACAVFRMRSSEPLAGSPVTK